MKKIKISNRLFKNRFERKLFLILFSPFITKEDKDSVVLIVDDKHYEGLKFNLIQFFKPAED